MPSPRIAPLAEPWPADVADELAAMMPPGVPPLALFRTLAHSPRILRKIRASNLLDRGPLERRDRELVILRVCARCGSEYEWGVHVALFAKRVGISEAEVAASLQVGARDALWTPRDQLLIRLADELHERAALSDDLWEALRAHWSDEQLIELIVLAGFYHTISFVTNALEIPLEDAAVRFPAR
jgi:4-carboxymuconolactone decarboxylase